MSQPENLPRVEWNDEALAQSPALDTFMEVLVQLPREDRAEMTRALLSGLEAGLAAMPSREFVARNLPK